MAMLSDRSQQDCVDIHTDSERQERAEFYRKQAERLEAML
jgi:hypothetical protein